VGDITMGVVLHIFGRNQQVLVPTNEPIFWLKFVRKLGYNPSL